MSKNCSLYFSGYISTLKAELLSIAIMIDTDNLYTKEEIKNSILGLVSKELDGYNLNLELLKNKKE